MTAAGQLCSPPPAEDARALSPSVRAAAVSMEGRNARTPPTGSRSGPPAAVRAVKPAPARERPRRQERHTETAGTAHPRPAPATPEPADFAEAAETFALPTTPTRVASCGCSLSGATATSPPWPRRSAPPSPPSANTSPNSASSTWSPSEPTGAGRSTVSTTPTSSPSLTRLSATTPTSGGQHRDRVAQSSTPTSRDFRWAVLSEGGVGRGPARGRTACRWEATRL